MSSLHFIENESNTSSLWRMNSFLANNEPQDWNSMKTKSTETSTSLSPQKKRFSIFPELERDKIAQVSGPDSFSSWTPWNGALKIIANDEDEESSKSSASNLPLHLDFSEDLNVERQASYLDDSGLQHSSFGLAGVDPLSPKSSVDTTTDSASMSNRKVWIGGISKDANESSLKKWLLEFGEIEDLSIVRDDNGISKGFAYVTFESSKSTQAFVNTPYIQFDGRPLSVKLAIPKEIMNLNKIYVSSLPFSITSGKFQNYFIKVLLTDFWNRSTQYVFFSVRRSQ
jgi:RNA recognition motif-containing protein